MGFLQNFLKIIKKEPEKKKVEKVEKVAQVEKVERKHFEPKPRSDDFYAEKAKAEAKEIIVEAKDYALKIRQEAEEEIRRRRVSFSKEEEFLGERKTKLEERERFLAEKEKEITTKLGELDNIKQIQVGKLEKIAKMTRDEAKNLILKATEDHLKEDVAKRIKEAEQQAKETAEKKAREILVEAMKYGATDYVPEYTVSTVKLADETFKGRIIGKEGRNIRTFEQVSGVDVDLEEEGVIRLSSFDPIRREVARAALEKLVRDGRIQPARIEEVVVRTKSEIERIMLQEGEKLCHAVGVYNLPHDKISLLGRFKYRFSYGQNMIAHTLEETRIGVALAHELGANVNIVRLGCLLHDVGKVITEEEGNHVDIAVKLLKKNNIPQAVIDCVAQHHEDTPFTSVEAVIVYIADAISGSRPGARYEDYAEYVKRLTKLEEIAKELPGVESAYAIQAGREVRVIVNPKEVDDAQSVVLAQKIKEKVEDKLTYPGQVKITVIRETRAQEIAK